MTELPDHSVDGAEMFVALAAQERRVLNLLLGHRKIAEPIVRAAGLEMRHFEQDDHRLIFAGWLVACEDDLTHLHTLSVVCRALREAGLWDDATPRGSDGMRHSFATVLEIGNAAITDEELQDMVGNGNGDGLRRGIARQVCALVDAADAVAGVNP
jgi:hypothetical protein